MRSATAAGSIGAMFDLDEIVEPDDELAEDERETDLLEELDPVDFVEAHLAGVPFN